jgi:hypothetical protein
MSAAHDDFPPVEVYERMLAPDEPLIVRYPGNGTMYVRTSAGGWVPTDDKLLRGELARHHPDLPLFEDGRYGPKPIAVAQLVEQYGRRCDELLFDLTRTDSHFRPSADGGGQLLLGCGLCSDVTAKYDARVDKWLRLLGGDQAERLLDWLATATDLTWPSSALYLFGPKSAGKGLLAAGLARLWGRAVTSYADVTGPGGWNSALRHCPIIHLDEGCQPPKDGSASMRSLTGEVQRPLVEKYRPAGTLIGAVRVMVSANNLDALHLEDVKTADDEEAVGERIFMIQITRSSPKTSHAGDYLASLGGRDATIGWVSDPDTGAPGPLARHIAWLVENRQVKRGSRFAVHGEAGAWIRGAGLRQGIAQDILIAIIHALTGERGDWSNDLAPVWVHKGQALVNTSRLHERWKVLTLSQNQPSERRIGEALAVLSVGESRTSPTPMSPRVRARHIAAEQVLAVSRQLGIGDYDYLADLFETARPVAVESVRA